MIWLPFFLAAIETHFTWPLQVLEPQELSRVMYWPRIDSSDILCGKILVTIALPLSSTLIWGHYVENTMGRFSCWLYHRSPINLRHHAVYATRQHISMHAMVYGVLTQARIEDRLRKKVEEPVPFIRHARGRLCKPVLPTHSCGTNRLHYAHSTV